MNANLPPSHMYALVYRGGISEVKISTALILTVLREWLDDNIYLSNKYSNVFDVFSKTFAIYEVENSILA